jgi:hypothetical protein
MLPIMCTRNLWRVVGGVGALPARQPYVPASTRLAAWCVREVPTPEGLIGVGLEETTYLTVVFPIAPLPNFVPLFATAVGEALLDLGVSPVATNSEVAAIIAGGQLVRNDNRSLLGSANDVVFHTQVYLEDEPVSLHAMRVAQRKLNEMPHVKREPAFPEVAIQLLFAEGASAH